MPIATAAAAAADARTRPGPAAVAARRRSPRGAPHRVSCSRRTGCRRATTPSRRAPRRRRAGRTRRTAHRSDDQLGRGEDESAPRAEGRRSGRRFAGRSRAFRPRSVARCSSRGPVTAHRPHHDRPDPQPDEHEAPDVARADVVLAEELGPGAPVDEAAEPELEEQRQGAPRRTRSRTRPATTARATGGRAARVRGEQNDRRR